MWQLDAPDYDCATVPVDSVADEDLRELYETVPVVGFLVLAVEFAALIALVATAAAAVAVMAYGLTLSLKVHWMLLQNWSSVGLHARV